MTKKERAALIVEKIKEMYPDALCSLQYSDPLQLIIAVVLSAQCTDERVNKVTPALFERFPDLDAFCEADAEEIGRYIHSCGFYNSKSKNILALCQTVKNEYGGELPDTVEELVKLPGVGRKTANLICGDVYGKDGYVVDTHMIRISQRMGLCSVKGGESNPALKIEMQLRKLIDESEASDFCHRIVLHGRALCTARKAKCEECDLNEICKKNIK
ncbi:MAG: endonuclease III [Ruminococcaceae bacterium]|nr:endonuclease III [Oscillospiraceae bacterium]